MFGYISKKRCLYRLFIYHFKAHTISNKLVSKVFAQKREEKSYDSYKYVFKFRIPTPEEAEISYKETEAANKEVEKLQTVTQKWKYIQHQNSK